MLVDLEIEHHVHAVAVAAEIFHIGVRQHVRLGEHNTVTLTPLQKLAKRPQHVVLFLGLADLCPLFGDHKGHGIHAEARDTELDPKSHDLEDLRLDFGVRGIEVGLEIVETVEIVGASLLIISPGRLLHPGKHHPLLGTSWLRLRPNIPIAVLRLRIATCFLEPWMLVRGMIDDEIDQYAYAALFGSVREGDEVTERAIASIDAVVVRHIIPIIAMRRGLARHKPNSGTAQTVQIIQPAFQAAKIASAVAIGIHERANGQTVDDGILIPEITDHAAPLLGIWRGSPLPRMTPSFGCKTSSVRAVHWSARVDRRTRLPAHEGNWICLAAPCKLRAMRIRSSSANRS